MTMTRTATAPISPRRRQWRSYAACVVALGLLFLGRGAWDAVEVTQFALHGIVTDARVVGITIVPEGRGRMGRYARVRYVVADGKPIIATTEDRVDNLKIGDALRVSYLSTDPESVRQAADAGTLGAWSWLTLGLGLVISLTGVLWLRHLRRQPI